MWLPCEREMLVSIVGCLNPAQPSGTKLTISLPKNMMAKPFSAILH